MTLPRTHYTSPSGIEIERKGWLETFEFHFRTTLPVPHINKMVTSFRKVASWPMGTRRIPRQVQSCNATALLVPYQKQA